MSEDLALGSDHAGLNLKNHLLDWLREQGHDVHDYGVHSPESMDYPDIAATVARAVASGQHAKGIIVCGSGLGVSIAANKIAGIRAVPCTDPISARLSREHNDCNVLTLGERLTTPMVAEEIITTWLKAEFQAGRHCQRVDKITALEHPTENTTEHTSEDTTEQNHA